MQSELSVRHRQRYRRGQHRRHTHPAGRRRQPTGRLAGGTAERLHLLHAEDGPGETAAGHHPDAALRLYHLH